MSNQLIINEPPRFGLESRGRNKDINTRKFKELQKMKQMVIIEKAKKEEEKRLKKQPPKDPNQPPKKIKSPQPQQQISQPRPPLVIGQDSDKESLYPQAQDYDRDEINPNELIYGTKKIGNCFHDDVILAYDSKERLELQKAIEDSIKEFVETSSIEVVDKVIQEMEEDFVLCESESDFESDDEKNIECWELMDEASSSHLVNLISTPYIRLNSDKEFPMLPRTKAIHKEANLTNPWNHTKLLIQTISQQS